ncbi:inosine/xanthosine triphosphatase [Glaciecola sp. 1036]|uniref:inosine/xanthosine triphosphatase n=1 Tax=Alteromonadaceae TaxID=72275 RepID=UPI003CFEF0C8
MSSLKINVGSNNPVKINAARVAFEQVFPNQEIVTLGVSVDSGVADQPMDYEATRLGAQNRVEALIKNSEADYYIAYEGGVDVFEDGPKTFAVICISNGDKTYLGQTSTLPIPTSVYEQLLSGIELGTAIDALFDTQNIKQKGGAIGQFTQGIETRQSIYQSATVLALAPFVHSTLFD